MALGGFGVDLLAERTQVALRAAVRNDTLQSGKRRAHARDLRFRLSAAADDAERRGAVTRKVLRGDGARGARAQPAEPVGLEDGDELRTLGGEQRHDERGAASESGVRLHARVA